MGMIGLGIGLIVVGLLLALTGFWGIAGIVQTIGWILLAVGVILAIVYALGNASRRQVP